MNLEWKPFNLNLKEDKVFMEVYNMIKNDEMLEDVPRTPEGKLTFRITQKNQIGQDMPVVPWDKVSPGDILWLLNEESGVYKEIGVTLVYEGVVFYKWLYEEDDKIHHFELGSLKATKMVYPYSITVPEDVIIVDVYNPKQIYNYV